MAFDSARLGVEEVAHHGDIVRSTRHRDGFLGGDDGKRGEGEYMELMVCDYEFMDGK